MIRRHNYPRRHCGAGPRVFRLLKQLSFIALILITFTHLARLASVVAAAERYEGRPRSGVVLSSVRVRSPASPLGNRRAALSGGTRASRLSTGASPARHAPARRALTPRWAPRAPQRTRGVRARAHLPARPQNAGTRAGAAVAPLGIIPRAPAPGRRDDFLLLEHVPHGPLDDTPEHGAAAGPAVAEIHGTCYPGGRPFRSGARSRPPVIVASSTVRPCTGSPGAASASTAATAERCPRAAAVPPRDNALALRGAGLRCSGVEERPASFLASSDLRS